MLSNNNKTGREVTTNGEAKYNGPSPKYKGNGFRSKYKGERERLYLAKKYFSGVAVRVFGSNRILSYEPIAILILFSNY